MKLNALGIIIFIVLSTQVVQARHACFLWFNCSHSDSDCRTEGCPSNQFCSNNKPGPTSQNDPFTCREEGSPIYRSPQVMKRATCTKDNCGGVCVGNTCMMYAKAPEAPRAIPKIEPRGMQPCMNKEEETANPFGFRAIMCLQKNRDTGECIKWEDQTGQKVL